MLRKLPQTALALWVLGLSASACVTRFLSTGYDQRTVVVHTFNLFNQKKLAPGASIAWSGDWIFRRDRLELIDEYFRAHRGDLVLFQQLMRKAQGEVEWDQTILAAGSFSEFDWRSEEVATWVDSSESESLAVAATTALRLRARQPGEAPSSWNVGSDGFLQAVSVEVSGEAVAVFNVQMPSAIERDPIWFTFIEERVKDWVRVQGICPRRLIVGGFIPADVEVATFKRFLSNLGLKDSSDGFCDSVARCQTADPGNEIYRLAGEGDVPAQVDRILVSEGAVVYSAARTHDGSKLAPPYEVAMGLTRLWPSTRSGWETSVRLASCGAGPFN